MQWRLPQDNADLDLLIVLCVIQELQMQSSAAEGEEVKRPESRSPQELAADSLVGKATSEILM